MAEHGDVERASTGEGLGMSGRGRSCGWVPGTRICERVSNVVWREGRGGEGGKE